MTEVEIGLAGLGILFGLIALRVPIGVALIAVSFGGLWWMMGWRIAWGALATMPYSFAANWVLSSVPMFLLLATTGMMMLTSAMELVTLYISMELAAYPIYIAVALHRSRSIGGESSTKYMLQGMVASAITLYGLSFLFGLSGSTYLGTISSQLGTLATQPLFWLVVLLVLAGFLFKLAAFPFHFWAPDTYQTAPHEVVTFVATASKVAATAVLCRVVALVAPAGVDAAMASRVLMWMSVAAITRKSPATSRSSSPTPCRAGRRNRHRSSPPHTPAATPPTAAHLPW